MDDQVSITIENQEIFVSSDSEVESPSSTLNYNLRSLEKNGMIKLEEHGQEHDLIKAGFLSGMGQFGKDIEVVAIHKNSCSSIMSKSFGNSSEAMRKKCGGDANIKYAWFAASKDEICKIISNGFSTITHPKFGHSYGIGVHLYPANVDGVLCAEEDEDGLRHMLLCQVILGNMEVIEASSKQFQPTSKHFDSGVDNYLAPKIYIIWPSNMNSHILPNFILTFKAPFSLGNTSKLNKVSLKPTPRIKFSNLLHLLSKYLHPSKMALIQKYYQDFQRNKMSKMVLLQKLRQIAGDTSLLKTCHEIVSKH